MKQQYGLKLKLYIRNKQISEAVNRRTFSLFYSFLRNWKFNVMMILSKKLDMFQYITE